MACNSNDVVNMALAQVGNVCGKTSEYAKELDSVKFYNYPKNGAANSCSIFVDDMVYRCCDPKTADYARSVVYEPNKDNCGASCTYSASYFKSHKAWIAKSKDFQTGDKIFFKKKDGKLYHTGIIVELGDKITTVEGNTNGGKVAKKTYSFSDSKIAGAGRPAYSVVVSAPSPAPAPTPAPAPAPSFNIYHVRVNSVLNVRKGPGTNFLRVGQLKNGTAVTVYETSGSWGRIGDKRWVSMKYLVK